VGWTQPGGPRVLRERRSKGRANGADGQRGVDEAAERVGPRQRGWIVESDGRIRPMGDEEGVEAERIGQEPQCRAVLDDPYASDEGWIYR
jgi:hypothetical protein